MKHNNYCVLVYTTKVNSTFHAHWLASYWIHLQAVQEKQNGFCRYIVTNKVTLWSCYSACVVYTKEGLPGGVHVPLFPRKKLEFLPCSPKISQDVPLNSLLLSSPVPRNSIACSLDPQKYSLMFPKIPNVFQFLMVHTYVHTYILYLISRLC